MKQKIYRVIVSLIALTVAGVAIRNLFIQPSFDPQKQEKKVSSANELDEQAVNVLLEDKLDELAQRYGIIPTGSKTYSGTGYSGGETVVPATHLTGLLCADRYDYDGDDQNELLMVRAEPEEPYEMGSSIGYSKITLYLSMYDLSEDSENPSVTLSDEKSLCIMGLSDTSYSSSIQLMRGVDDHGAALYLDYYLNMNTQAFGMIRITYDGKLNISGGVDCSEFDASVFCHTDAQESVLDDVMGSMNGANSSDWKECREYDWEGKAAEISSDEFESYRRDWETGLRAINITDTAFRTSYDYAIPVIHENDEARIQYFADLCTRRPADTCTMPNGGTLTELCGILSPNEFSASIEHSIELTCYDSTGLLDLQRNLAAEEIPSVSEKNYGSDSTNTSPSADSSINSKTSDFTTSDKLFDAFTTAFLQQDSNAIAALYGMESEEKRASLKELWAQRLSEVTFGNYTGIQTVSSGAAEILSAEEAASLCSNYTTPPNAACRMIITASPDWSQVWPDWIAGGIELYAAEYDGIWYLIP